MWSGAIDVVFTLTASALWYLAGHASAKSKFGKVCEYCGEFLNDVEKAQPTESSK